MGIPTAHAEDAPHWLVGLWVGELRNAASGEVAARILAVSEVSADGTAKAGWSAVPPPAIGNAIARVSGTRVTITTNAGSLVELVYDGARTLTGTVRAQYAAQAYPLTLIKR